MEKEANWLRTSGGEKQDRAVPEHLTTLHPREESNRGQHVSESKLATQSDPGRPIVFGSNKNPTNKTREAHHHCQGEWTTRVSALLFHELELILLYWETPSDQAFYHNKLPGLRCDFGPQRPATSFLHLDAPGNPLKGNSFCPTRQGQQGVSAPPKKLSRPN